MRISKVEIEVPNVVAIDVSDDSLSAELEDGRLVSVPLAWYPRLLNGSPEERSNWRLIGDGEGVHWPDLDEDVSVENLLAGHRSGENQTSFKGWLDARVPGNNPA